MRRKKARKESKTRGNKTSRLGTLKPSKSRRKALRNKVTRPVAATKHFENARLTIELVPSTSWFSNVRSEVDPETWDLLRRLTYKKAKYLCEVCGGRGPTWPVACHEIWQYDDKNHIQKLVGLIALCPSCHEVKHIGLAGIQRHGSRARKHLAKVNEWTRRQTRDYIDWAFEVWEQRSRHVWKLDLDWLKQYGIKLATKDKTRGLANRAKRGRRYQ